MTRRFDAPTLLVATHNDGKLAEIETLLAAYPVALVSAKALGPPSRRRPKKDLCRQRSDQGPCRGESERPAVAGRR